MDDLERIEHVMDYVAKHLDADFIARHCAVPLEARLSPAAFCYRLTERARALGKRIVLPEGDEPRTVQAAAICAERGIARCVLLGDPARGAAGGGRAGRDTTAQRRDPRFRARSASVTSRRSSSSASTRGSRPASRRAPGRQRLARHDDARARARWTGWCRAPCTRPPTRFGRPCRSSRRRPERRSCRRFSSCACPSRWSCTATARSIPEPERGDARRHRDSERRLARCASALPARVAMISYSTGETGSGSDVDKVREATQRAQKLRPDLAHRRASSVRRRGDPGGRGDQGPEEPGRRPRHGVRFPGPEHRQHHLQGRSAERQRREHRSDAAGHATSRERPLARGARRGHRLHDRAHGDSGRRLTRRRLSRNARSVTGSD